MDIPNQIMVTKFNEVTIFLRRKYEEGRHDANLLVKSLTRLGIPCYVYEGKTERIKGVYYAPSGTYCVKLGEPNG